MNAKKIMGAVLVALLAAALFIGAGAAAEGKDYGTVFVYQNTSDVKVSDGTNNVLLPAGIWNSGAAQITVSDDGIVYPGANFVAGTYTKGNDKVYVTFPTASYTVKATIGTPGTPYLVANGGNVYKTSDLTIDVTGAAKNFNVNYVLLTYPDGSVANVSEDAIQNKNLTKGKTGTYKIQAIFGTAGFVEGVPSNLLLDTVNALTFKVVGAEDAKISASANTVYLGETVTFTIKGTPGTKYILNTTDFVIENNQLVVITPATGVGYNFTMPNVGEASFVAKVNKDKEATLVLKYYNATNVVKNVKNGEIKIQVSAPVVTATLGADSYFIGEQIKLTGTSTAADATFKFNITGTNKAETALNIDESSWGKNWKVTLSLKEKVDVGTYTIKVYQDKAVVATVAVALKQPFISITDAPETVVLGTDAKFIVNAESASKIQAYVFGTNYFEVFNGKLVDEDVKDEFEVVIPKETTKNLSAGQYFVVFQHPMYNKIYNIFDGANGAILLNTTNAKEQPQDGTLLFNVYDRQTANAAQALCDALDSQNIDDMYVKYSFFIVGQDESFTMSEIPTEVTKGTQIVISGVSTANKDETVTVEMISTAFAAVPKETVGSAAFIVATAKVAEDGTWEVTLDTSDLNVDEYSVKVACSNNDKPWKNVKVNVIEGAPVTPTDEPTVVPTDAPVTPTDAPKTPGFGALAALAGLGAVAVLLLRRE